MAETIVTNQVGVTGNYAGEPISFTSTPVSVTIISGLEAVKTADKDFWVNGPLTYTVVIHNTTGVPFTDGIFRDEFDSNITLDTQYGVFVDEEPLSYYSFDANILTFALPEIEDGATVTVTFRALQE